MPSFTSFIKAITELIDALKPSLTSRGVGVIGAGIGLIMASEPGILEYLYSAFSCSVSGSGSNQVETPPGSNVPFLLFGGVVIAIGFYMTYKGINEIPNTTRSDSIKALEEILQADEDDTLNPRIQSLYSDIYGMIPSTPVIRKMWKSIDPNAASFYFKTAKEEIPLGAPSIDIKTNKVETKIKQLTRIYVTLAASLFLYLAFAHFFLEGQRKIDIVLTAITIFPAALIFIIMQIKKKSAAIKLHELLCPQDKK